MFFIHVSIVSYFPIITNNLLGNNKYSTCCNHGYKAWEHFPGLIFWLIFEIPQVQGLPVACSGLVCQVRWGNEWKLESQLWGCLICPFSTSTPLGFSRSLDNVILPLFMNPDGGSVLGLERATSSAHAEPRGSSSAFLIFCQFSSTSPPVGVLQHSHRLQQLPRASRAPVQCSGRCPKPAWMHLGAGVPKAWETKAGGNREK